MPADPTLYAYEQDGGWNVGANSFSGLWPTREEAEAAIARYNAAVVESSPEVAELRSQIVAARTAKDYAERCISPSAPGYVAHADTASAERSPRKRK